MPTPEWRSRPATIISRAWRPARIGAGTLNLFFAEDKTYAHRLTAAGVHCKFVTVPGAFHALDLVAQRAGVTKNHFVAQCDALRAAFAD